MDVIDAIKSRRSIRGFKAAPIPQEILKELLGIALRAPSISNAQTWEIAVITGEILEKIKRGNVEKLTSGAPPQSDLHIERLAEESAYRERQRGLRSLLGELVGFDQDDKEQWTKWFQRPISFFDAPAVIILFADKSLSESRTQYDIALLSQTICLAAMKYGLGTVHDGMAVMAYPEVIREATGIPQSKRITVSIPIGYPDWDDPVNKIVTAREPVENVATWYGFG